MLDHPTICIIGAGAVGGYYGGRLAQHGNNVHFLLRGDYEAVRKNGWTIKSCNGDFSLPPGSFGVASEAKKMPKADLVLVTLKTTTNDQLEPLISPLMKDDTAILTLQNGLGSEERLSALFGRQHVLGGIAFTCLTRVAPGVIHHTAAGWVRIGEFGGGPSPRATRIAEILSSAHIDCTVMDNLRQGRWDKLSWNIPFNGLGAVLDWTTDRLIATDEGLSLVTGVIEEVVAGAGALGVTLPADTAKAQIDKTRPLGQYLTSMQVDRREGREMEVEAILGEPFRQGTGAGAAMPRIGTLYEMAKMVNRGK